MSVVRKKFIGQIQLYGNLPYKCSMQKKRQIQLAVRDRMNSICPMNFFRTTDTTDTTDTTIWKPGFMETSRTNAQYKRNDRYNLLNEIEWILSVLWIFFRTTDTNGKWQTYLCYFILWLWLLITHGAMELSKIVSVSVPDNNFEGMQLIVPGFRPFHCEFMGKQCPWENVRLFNWNYISKEVYF